MSYTAIKNERRKALSRVIKDLENGSITGEDLFRLQRAIEDCLKTFCTITKGDNNE